MGLLSRLRAWIGGVLSGDGTGESPAEESGDDESDGTGESPAEESGDDESDAADEPAGLDPSAATETRTAATDDAVDALRDVRRSRQAEDSTDESDSTDGGDPPDRRKD